MSHEAPTPVLGSQRRCTPALSIYNIIWSSETSLLHPTCMVCDEDHTGIVKKPWLEPRRLPPSQIRSDRKGEWIPQYDTSIGNTTKVLFGGGLINNPNHENLICT